MEVSEFTPPVQVFELKTLDRRTVRFTQSIDRFQHPVVAVDVFGANMERQATFKIGFKDLGVIRLALGTFADAMLEGMCDY